MALLVSIIRDDATLPHIVGYSQNIASDIASEVLLCCKTWIKTSFKRPVHWRVGLDLLFTCIRAFV